MTRDLYAEARALGSDLADAGSSEWDSRIDDAIASGATATEILMALHWTLDECMTRETRLDPVLKERVASLEKEIGRVLG
jgi:hypothetical protein